MIEKNNQDIAKVAFEWMQVAVKDTGTPRR